MGVSPSGTQFAGPVVETGRLTLIAFDPHLARLQSEDREGFFAALGVKYEPSWPPELTTAETMDWMAGHLESRPDNAGWYSWVFTMDVGPGQQPRLVGIGGFHGPPGDGGCIEISYSMLPSFREQGLATEAVLGLLSWAEAQPGVSKVTASTLTHLYAARRVLEKAGFSLVGERDSGEGRVSDFALDLPASAG
ncbi:GNAT family N-acetyltransferase [Marinicauda sp. Alg238-R41]|uniref:GNAT family N-acetyltransferase n=1 Tax=Marinicauda sp. Alg238-R41 TaxID=2993447 RepID=UPI0022E60925|nr:GNAT family N-acetyltransferase [Marinicauda sp. Alg238-R41]